MTPHVEEALIAPVVRVEPRPYQIRTVDNVLKAIEAGHKTILMEAPTGAGKTIMALRIAEALRAKHGWDFGWTCMRRALLAQAERECLDKFPDLHPAGTFFSTFAKELPKGKKLLIEDEAQHSAADTSTSVHNVVKPFVHLAMTATPYRTDSMKLVFSKVIKDAGLRQLVDEGWLSSYHHYSFEDVWCPITVAGHYNKAPELWGKSVIFFLTLTDCYACKSLLEMGGIRAEVVEGGDPHRQEQIIEKFREGKLDVLLNVFVLTEGFDAPELKTVFIRPGSKGPTVQMGGRAFRKHASKPFAQLVQNGVTDWPFPRLVSPEDKFVFENDTWVSRKSSAALMHKVYMNSMAKIARTAPSQLPPYLKRQVTPRNSTMTPEQMAERRNRGQQNGQGAPPQPAPPPADQ